MKDYYTSKQDRYGPDSPQEVAEDARRKRTKEILAIMEEMVEELKPREGFEVLGLVHGLESVNTLKELKTRIQESPSPTGGEEA